MSNWHRRPTIGKQGETKKSEWKRHYNSERWRSSRLRFLEHNPLCVSCQSAGKVTPAGVVDHIQPHRGNLDLFWDQGNWQALCKKCHDTKTASETRAVPHFPRVEKPLCRVYVVAGAPGSGKSYLVERRKKPDALVIDQDIILAEMTGRPVHTQASPKELRLALIERNRRLAGLVDVPREREVWFITTAPRWSDRRRWQEILGARLILLDTPPEVCLDRMRGRPGGVEWYNVVNYWFSCYSAGWDDEITPGC